jgi:hypothetical protein
MRLTFVGAQGTVRRAGMLALRSELKPPPNVGPTFSGCATKFRRGVGPVLSLRAKRGNPPLLALGSLRRSRRGPVRRSAVRWGCASGPAMTSSGCRRPPHKTPSHTLRGTSRFPLNGFALSAIISLGRGNEVFGSGARRDGRFGPGREERFPGRFSGRRFGVRENERCDISRGPGRARNKSGVFSDSKRSDS